jgi:hypothetical protein
VAQLFSLGRLAHITMKSPKQKHARAPIHLPDFGCVNALYFDKGGYARVQMNSLEIGKLLAAIERYALRRQKIPDPKVLAAIDTLCAFFDNPIKGYDITVTADMVIDTRGVELVPVVEKAGGSW